MNLQVGLRVELRVQGFGFLKVCNCKGWRLLGFGVHRFEDKA